MQKQQPTFHPVSKAPSILEITHSMLESSKNQLVNMEKVKDKPHVLNDKLISRSIKLYTEQNEDSDVFLQQCAIWRKNDLTEVQLYQVKKIEDNTHALIKINNQILSIVNACKDLTIDKILAKDNVELAFDMLTGKIPFPK